MPEWIPCGKTFIAGDVLQWNEPAWKKKARKGSRPIGERTITAQIIKCDAEWVELALESCETKNAETWWKKIPEFKLNEPLRRRRNWLADKSPKRRPWGGKDGEAARVLAASRFMGS
jgi:hypothetical protein